MPQSKTPHLRFKGFSGEWEEKKIIDIAPLQRGFDLPKSEMKVGFYPVVMSNGINCYHSVFKVKAPGIVTGRSGTIGVIHYVTSDYWPHNTTLWVTDFKENIPIYIFYMYTKFDLNRFATGSGVPTLNRNDVHGKQIFIPNPTEQTKIGDYFQRLDALIEQKEKKHQKLKQFKIAMLSQLFPKGGEHTPALRFKGFSGEWEEQQLGEVLDYIQPTKYLVDSIEYDDAYETPVLTAGKTFILGYTDETTGIFKEGLPVIIFDDFTTATKFVDFPFKAKSSAMKILTAKEGANIKFLFEVMQIIKYEVGGHERHWISKFSNFFILLPNIEEQTKIGNYFQKLDTLINLHQQELEKLKTMKKALLAKMFV